MNTLNMRWDGILSKLSFAYQPIVNIHTGTSVGHEALLRGHKEAGFESQYLLFDAALIAGVLEQVESLMLVQAFDTFLSRGAHLKGRLFLNLDGRALRHIPALLKDLQECAHRHGATNDTIVFELSERNMLSYDQRLFGIFDEIRQANCKIALDDFGVGYSGMQMLFYSNPNYIKIDRFFIQGLENDPKKKFFVSNLIKMAHLMGLFVIAEGIETPNEFYICWELGADLAQGYLVYHPTANFSALRRKYAQVEELVQKDRRQASTDERRIAAEIREVPPLALYNTNGKLKEAEQLIEGFRMNPKESFLPAVNEIGEPAGIIRERDIKEYVYSPYGHSLLKNKSTSISNFISRCSMAEMNTPMEKIVEIVSREGGSEGVILTKSGRYAGVLDTTSLLRIMHDKNLDSARDQNPLTRLPGNRAVAGFISKAVEDASAAYIMAHFDFDNFKPFNDRYGFRTGDRAIHLFADILKDMALSHHAFIGHIGGDDFFAGTAASSGAEMDEVLGSIKQVICRFSESASELYSKEDRERGLVVMLDRQGTERTFPLLSVSAAVIVVDEGGRRHTAEDFDIIFTDAKKHAKRSADHLAFVKLDAVNRLCADANLV